MPSGLPSFARVIVVLALLASVGGHWALLQSVAWTRMLVERTRGESFARAVVETFDGEHPCVLCKRIAEGKQNEKQPDKAPIVGKIDLLFELRPLAILPPSAPVEFPDRAFHAQSRVESPPVPPPRAA